MLAQLGERATLDLRVMNLRPICGVRITYISYTLKNK